MVVLIFQTSYPPCKEEGGGTMENVQRRFIYLFVIYCDSGVSSKAKGMALLFPSFFLGWGVSL